jgi:hypothetical protein
MRILFSAKLVNVLRSPLLLPTDRMPPASTTILGRVPSPTAWGVAFYGPLPRSRDYLQDACSLNVPVVIWCDPNP